LPVSGRRERAIEQDRAWAALMAAAQDGDGAAYAELLAGIAPFVRALVRRRCGDPELVDDVVQDTLLTLHRVRASYDPRRPFSAWLAAIAARRAIDALRRRGRTRAHERRDDQAYETFADSSANKSGEAAETAQVLQALIAELPERQRQALELVKVGEMSLAEASAASGQSVGALKVNVHRALKALRLRLMGTKA
jgi:RNA polymerase sigma-70 factor (ECF subfamily)